jgi:hypothetical protein
MKMLQVCEESGTDLAQQLLKRKRAARKQGEKRVSNLEATQTTGALAVPHKLFIFKAPKLLSEIYFLMS